MGVTGIEQLRAAAERVTDVLKLAPDDLRPIGQAAAEAVVATTLAGVGDGDAAFAPYSPAYLARLAAAGATKPAGVVDLRGVLADGPSAGPRGRFTPAAKARKGNAAASFVAAGNTNRPAVRPDLGLTDPDSELSLDLIRVDATADRVELAYTPRAKPYMLFHQTGTSTLPARPWFSLRKSAVRERVVAMAKALLAARANWFNSGGRS